MNFNIINQNEWNRKNTYDQFYNNSPCTFSMTVNIDITSLYKTVKCNNLKLFPTILFGLSHVVNSHKEFRMDLNSDGQVGYYDVSNPYFTIFHNETETFTNVWTEYDSDYTVFIQNYHRDMMKYENDCVNSRPILSNNLFNVSCIPWTSFTGFNLNLQKGYDYFPPIFTIGKFYEENEKYMLPLALQVHHAVCDGYHVARFINELQELVDSFIL